MAFTHPVAEVEYGGFWRRLVAAVIDGILFSAISVPAGIAVYGEDRIFPAGPTLVEVPDNFWIGTLLPLILTVFFWVRWAATPGKMVMNLKVLRADDGRYVTMWQGVGRYCAYFISAFFFMLGFIWIAFDRRKQGWHDKLAGTVVIHQRSVTP
ncbi:RDD family protein [Acuticoccus mangrovi]|uniref:RDD family protein n=1 Tax=Acuticoccus mangrovi TaxID=2796142 RepID=A0A934MD86_9HYPH|nr:RDD family protein [Acuticoccus mangrovi]MBJ3776082.1 RDD family protein [Acuticoccus mangrovi]